MREICFNGYIDDQMYFGDEITPEALHAQVYGEDGSQTDDIHITLNSYGGSCNAAVRMHDDLKAYSGKVTITVSGTAASAATVLAMAADRLEMTAGSLFMIHDPLIQAWGNERDLTDAIGLLRASKNSILNVYGTRCRLERRELSDMMTESTWMDAEKACTDGFVDAVLKGAKPQPVNAAACRADAEQRVNAWFERKRTPPKTAAAMVLQNIPAAQLHKRLNLIKPQEK